MKKILPTIAALSATLFLGLFIIHTAHAEADYTPLAPLPGTYTGSESAPTTNISTYLGGAIKLLIALGAGLAVLMAVIGGTQYVAAGIAPDAKSGAKERLMNAFIGLALVLSSYLILYSINPDLVDFELKLPAVGTTAVVTPPPPPPPPPPHDNGTPGSGWGDDATWRSQLQAGGVQVKTPVCMTPGTGTNSQDGQHNCTSVYQLPSRAISGAIALKNACNCAVIITQGTEFWLHKTHGTPTSRSPVVDIRYQNPLNTFITNGRTPVNPQSGCGIRNADHYSVSGATYVLENPGTGNAHWHVCF